MKRSVKLPLFPWLTLLLGGIGCGLRFWLLSGMDHNGLLPASHPAGVITLILLGLQMIICFLATDSLTSVSQYSALFPRSLPAAAGSLAAAVGLLYSAIGKIPGSGLLGILIGLTGFAATLCILYAGYCRLKGWRCHYLARVVICSYLMLYLILNCRNWGVEPQPHLYFFQLLAVLFLVLASYFRTVLDAQKSNRRPYVFVTQCALFCCMLAVAGGDVLFYVTMALWMATDCCTANHRTPRFLKR